MVAGICLQTLILIGIIYYTNWNKEVSYLASVSLLCYVPPLCRGLNAWLTLNSAGRASRESGSEMGRNGAGVINPMQDEDHLFGFSKLLFLWTISFDFLLDNVVTWSPSQIFKFVFIVQTKILSLKKIKLKTQSQDHDIQNNMYYFRMFHLNQD